MKVYLQFFTLLVSAILLSTVGLVSCDVIQTRLMDSLQRPDRVKMLRMRCTRRFSPGVCAENVKPVWTFVFLQQNCTERLGCPNHYRTNRFRSYKTCMRRCRPLIEMYLKLLELEERDTGTNVTLDDSGDVHNTEVLKLREGFTKSLPASGSTKFPLEEVEDQDDEEDEYKGHEEDTRFVVYKDRSVNEDIMPLDVDYVPGEIRSQVMMQW